MMSPQVVGEEMEPGRLYDAVNIILRLQSKNGGVAAWEPASAQSWLELLNPTEFFEDLVIEHEYVECSAACIQALVLFENLHPGHRKKEIKNYILGIDGDATPLHRAAKLLINAQMVDGDFPQQDIVGAFMKNCLLHYALYRNVFPIWDLAEYRKRVPLPSEAE